MRLLPSFLRGERRDTLENPSVDLVSALIGETDGTSVTGINLTPAKALRLTAVYACVRLISETIGSLPFPVYRRDGRSRVRVQEDPRWWLLNDQPNPEMYAMELHETVLGNANLWGHGYGYVVFDGAGVGSEIWPLRPDRTQSFRTKEGQLYYMTTLDSGERVPLMPEEVIDVKAIFGLSPVRVARDMISGAIATEEYGTRFWANNARPGGVIQVKGSMDDDQFNEFRRRWLSGHQGLKRSQLVGILTNGAEWKEVGIAPELAQFIETKKWGTRQIAQHFRLPPHTIGDLEGTVSRASIEQQAIELVVYGLRPWIVRYEQATKMRLFASQADRRALIYPELLVDGLMRGDMTARYKAYAQGIQFGFLSRADARELENLSWVDGLDTFLVPVNMMASDLVSTNQPLPDETLAALAYLELVLRNQPDMAPNLTQFIQSSLRDGRELTAD